MPDHLYQPHKPWLPEIMELDAAFNKYDRRGASFAFLHWHPRELPWSRFMDSWTEADQE